MLGRKNIRDSIGYVTLGLFSHALLDELLEAKRKPESPPEHKEMIKLAIDSLKAIESPEDIEQSRLENLVFQNYQEVTTLRKMFPTRQIKDSKSLRELLNTIVEKDNNKRKRLKSIDKGITFFAELAQKAVINAEYPEERVPAGVRQLVS